jgi:DNA uptake protein ComE-like DNA-binding protein
MERQMSEERDQDTQDRRDSDPGEPGQPTTEPRDNPEIDEEKLRMTREEMERVADAVKRAGGLARGARQDGINLAARLTDGQQVVVPGPGASAAGSGDGPVSLGTATAEDLDDIEGIGPVTAEKIIEFRDQSGGPPSSRARSR